MRDYEDFRCLTILIVPNNGTKNIGSIQLLADELIERGHHVIFAINITSEELLTCDLRENSVQSDNNYNKSQRKLDVIDFRALEGSPIEIVKNFCLKSIHIKLEESKEREDYYEKLIERVKPDIIIVESMLCSPALTNSGIPWVRLVFGSPNLCINDHRIPPAWSGLPKNGAKHIWQSFREQWDEIFNSFRKDLNDWCVSRGAPELPENLFHPHSPHLNINIFPNELIYNNKQLYSPKWAHFDCFMKKFEPKFQIPEELLRKPGKLIYFSLGSYGSSNLCLMKRLIYHFSKSDNKFIVSKGPLHQQYELADNMWGQESLPQSDVIQLVDLVITNGDYNTITQSFFHSKPLIVMPLFGEQLDNAQIVKENGFGLVLNPFTCTLSTTIGCINTMLDDLLVSHQTTKVSYRMQSSNSLKKVSVMIEKIVE